MLVHADVCETISSSPEQQRRDRDGKIQRPIKASGPRTAYNGWLRSTEQPHAGIGIPAIGRSQPNYGPCFRLLLKQAVCGEYQARYD